MKINEIIEPQHIDRPVSTLFNIEKIGRQQDLLGGDGSGSEGGCYAHGCEDPTDPHMYRKKSKMPSNLKNDAYFQYVRACSPFMKSNPYFPRIYKIIFKKFKDGYIKPSYHIEKLMSIREAQELIGEQELIAAIRGKIYSEVEGQILRRHSMSDIVRDISAATNLQKLVNFTDKNLIQAIQLIQQVKDSNPNFEVDMHLANFMIRLGTTGPQLVITDPLEDGGISIAAGFNPFTGGMVRSYGLDEPL